MEQTIMAEIYDRLHDIVYRTALAYCRNVQDAEDITHDVFMIRFEREDSFPDAEAEKAWMLRVTINECRDLHRRSNKRSAVPLEFAQDLPAKPDSEIAVCEAVNLLSERDRILIHLYYFEGYSVREVAEITHTREPVVWARLARARKRLKKLLGKEVLP